MSYLTGTKTKENIEAAFAREAQTENKYILFAEKAAEEGYKQVGNIFEQTAYIEKEHAKLWYKILNEGKIPETADNLRIACEGENQEWKKLYQQFAEEADQEGFVEIARLFRQIAEVERSHEMRFQKLFTNLEVLDK